MMAGNGTVEAERVLQSFAAHRFASLLHHFQLSNWVLCARAYGAASPTQAEAVHTLDAALRASTRVEIAKRHRLLGATTTYVTHDQIEAMTLADRIVVRNHGRIAHTGKPPDLYDQPPHLCVGGCIG